MSSLEFDTLLNSPGLLDVAGCGGIDVFILPSNSHLTQKEITLGIYRQVYIMSSDNFDTLLNRLFHTVKEHCVQASVLEKVFVPSKPRVRVQPEKDVMRPVGPMPALDVVFSLIVAEPQALDVTWDIQAADAAYVQPLVQKLLPLTEVTVKSQILYMVSLNTQSSKNAENSENVLPASQLPLIINPIESKLGTQVSINPTLNFVIYVPPLHHMPLQIYDEKGARVDSNAFLSPRWGSVLIQNFPEALNMTGKAQPLKVAVDVHSAMEILIAHLRLLIGLPEMPSHNGRLEVLQNSEGNNLEVDFLLRRRIQEQISSAVSSLTSLIKLLNTIKNIVITDEIGEKVKS